MPVWNGRLGQLNNQPMTMVGGPRKMVDAVTRTRARAVRSVARTVMMRERPARRLTPSGPLASRDGTRRLLRRARGAPDARHGGHRDGRSRRDDLGGLGGRLTRDRAI